MVLVEPAPNAGTNRWKKACIPIEEWGLGKLGLLFYIAMAWKLSLFRNKDVLDGLRGVF